MNNTKGLIIGVIVVIAAIGGAVALTSNSKTDAPSSNSDSSMAEHSSSSSNTNDKASTSEAVATDQVEIKDYAYSPKTITVKAGTTVTWTNKDSVRHDVTSDNESADAPKSELLANGETYSFKFNKPGTYTYHCTPHPYMKATVIVTE